MNIVYDNVIFSLQRFGGISLVWQELLTHMIDFAHHKMLFIEYRHKENNPFRRRIDLNDRDVILKSSWLLSIKRYLNPRITIKEPFIFHSSYFRTCSNKNAFNITTVHDFTYNYYRKGLAKWLHCWQRDRAIRHSERIVCISENTKRDLLKFLPDVDASKVKVIYNGVSEDYYVLNNEEGINDLPFAKGKYVVFVGGRASYKNFELVKKTVGKSKYNLVIVGSRLTRTEEIDLQKYLPKERYCETGFLPNKDLNIVYNNAAALVYPSAYEGFGIPVIEAQKAGCPVIAYNGSSIPEIIGETPLLMNELTEEELLCKIEMLSNSDLRKKIIADGLENAKRFSWDKMYQKYLELYKELLNSAG